MKALRFRLAIATTLAVSMTACSGGGTTSSLPKSITPTQPLSGAAAPRSATRTGTDSLRAQPGDSLRAVPGDSLRAQPGYPVFIPGDSLRAQPGDSLRAQPGDSLRAQPGDSLRAQTGQLCKNTSGTVAACDVKLNTLAATNAAVMWGYWPGDLRSAYNLPTGVAGAGMTVAVVAAFDNPNAESDLGVYRSTFGLSACTTANGCFTKVAGKGKNKLPNADPGWSVESSLDIEMVSAVCPNCNIILVEAKSDDMKDLADAANTAASYNPVSIGLSFYAAEAQTKGKYDDAFNQTGTGIVVTAASGDKGYGATYPASLPNVVAVGGTTLISYMNGWAERAWSGSGSGCSQYYSKPAWQHDTGCSNRMVADVSVVGDPLTGVAAYVSAAPSPGWNIMGGTSVSAPIVAAMFALNGSLGRLGSAGMYLMASQPGNFNDIVSGSNGTCAIAYMCQAAVGYDGPTGVGTPGGVFNALKLPQAPAVVPTAVPTAQGKSKGD